MSVQATVVSFESAPITEEIIKLTQNGMTDHQIGQLLGKHYKTIAYHRSKNNIGSGRSHQAKLTKRRRGQTAHKRSYGMSDFVGQEQPSGGRVKHGLNAFAPIMCRGADCPYRKTCNVSEGNLSEREPCKMETPLIITHTEQYCRELNVGEGDIASLTRIRHLIELDIKIMRCNRLVAVNPEMVYIVWKDGQPRQKLNPILRYDLLLMKERTKVLNDLLTATGYRS